MIRRSQLLAHRGLWKAENLEKNSSDAIKAALESGFGVEFDIRDSLKGVAVVSHDPPTGEEETLAFVMPFVRSFPDVSVALNVKSDGMAFGLSNQVKSPNHFFFDMSLPDHMDYLNRGLQVAARISELEKPDVRLGRIAWVDSFYEEWYLTEDPSIFDSFEKVIFVSPELHGRGNEQSWSFFAELMEKDSRFELCTDLISEFESFGGMSN